MSTFEYRHLVVDKRAQVLPGLNALGAEGWEVVCREPEDVGSYAYLLKRRVAEATQGTALRKGYGPRIKGTVVHSAANQSLPSADAAAAQRGTFTVIEDPALPASPWSEVSYDPAEGCWLVDGRKISGPDAEFARVHGYLPQREDSVSAEPSQAA